MTVTRQVTAGLPSSATVAASTAPSDSAGRPTALVTRLAGPVTPSPTTHAPTTTSSAPAVLGGFVPTKLRPGQKAPQFIVVSFDGVGWHEKWQYWRDIAAKVPFRFTGFLTGVYLQAPAVKTDLQQQAPELGPPGQ